MVLLDTGTPGTSREIYCTSRMRSQSQLRNDKYTMINRFVYKIRESCTVPKQELAYNSKSSNKTHKLPTYSD